MVISSGFMFTIIHLMISESYKKQGGGYLAHIACFAHYGDTLMKINSRNAVRRVLYDSPRIADDDRRERLNMKKYGIWKITLVTVSGEVVICEITARSGKDARSRTEALYEGCQILKMTRKTWLDGFSYAQLSAALMDCVPGYADALLTILADNGVFSGQDAATSDVD